MRVGWMVGFAAVLSAFASAQQPAANQASTERAALLARFDNPQDFLLRSGAGGTEWDVNYRTFIQTDETAASRGFPSHAAAARAILADAAKSPANVEKHLGFVLHIKHFSQAYRPESATADLRDLYTRLVDVKLGVNPRDLTPRAAAVRYVREHGMEIPSQDVVVALDTLFQNIDSKGQPFTQTELERDALEIARILGPTARTGAAAAWLRCEKSKCVPSTSTSVLVVNQAENSGVFMRLYAAADCPPDNCGVESIVVVDVESRDGGWIGVRNRLGPSTVSVQIAK
jgi:hypothetical protein